MTQDQEIAEVLEALEANQRRLQELVGGEVDAVVLPSGFPHMLQESQRELRRQRELLQTVLDSLPANIALLDSEGRIAEVNERWLRFARENDLPPEYPFAGADYLALCDEEIRQGLSDLLRGRVQRFECEYPCHSPDQQRWYHMTAVPISGGAVIVHIDVTSLWLAADSLRRGEEYYRSLFQSNPQPVWVADRDTGNIRDVNRAALKQYGYSRAEFIQLKEQDVWASSSTEDGLVRHRRKDGQEFFVEVYSHPVDYADWGGKLTLAIDTTEKVRAIRELRESRALLSTASTLSRVAAWAVDLPERRLTLSEDYRKFLGLGPVGLETVEESFELVAAEDRDRLREKFEQCCREGGSYQHQFRFELSGRLLWMEAAGEAVRDQDDRVVRVQGAVQDITERKRAEQRLAAQAALIDQASDAILVHSFDSRILFWSRGASVLYGWSNQEAVGALVEEITGWSNEHSEEFYAELRREGGWSSEVEVKDRNGKSLIIFSRCTLLRDAFGQKEAVMAIHSDVTERKQLQEQLRRSQRMESLGTLAGGIAHDLNNVLAPILVAAELLGDQSSETIGLLQTLQTSARRGADLVRQILTFARGRTGVRRAVDVLEILSDVQHLVMETFPRNIYLETEFAPDLRAIEAEPTELHQMVLNLCVNARDAMPEGGTLTIRAQNVDFRRADDSLEREGTYVRISVEDTGCGIPDSVREKVFEPFFTTKEPGRGTGLGLSTVFKIVGDLKGTIDIRTAVGKGTSLIIHLPALSMTGSDLQSAAPAKVPMTRGQGESILLVDDEESIRKLGQRALEREGFRVLLADNGAEGIELFKSHQDEIKLVITDISMPVMDGPRMVRMLRAMEPKVLIVGSSGRGSPGSDSFLEDAKFDEFVSKPYDIATLVSAIDRVLSRPLEEAEEPSHGTILLVDDDKTLLELMARAFQEDDVRVLVAASAAEALHHLRGEESLDCVVSDFNLPELNGEELQHEVFRYHPSTPVLLVSGAAHKSSILEKPFTLSELRDRVHKALRGRSIDDPSS